MQTPLGLNVERGVVDDKDHLPFLVLESVQQNGYFLSGSSPFLHQISGQDDQLHGRFVGRFQPPNQRLPRLHSLHLGAVVSVKQAFEILSPI